MGTLAELIAKSKTAVEPQTQPDGQYKLRIIALEEKFGKTSGKPYLNVAFGFENPEKTPAKPVYHMFMYEDPEQNDDINARRLLEMKHFIEAFELNADELAAGRFESAVGKTGWAIITEKDDGEFGLVNRISRFVKS